MATENTNFPRDPVSSNLTAGAPDDGLVHLRPTTSIELLDRAFEILRMRPALFAVLAIIASSRDAATYIVFALHGPMAEGQAYAFYILFSLTLLFIVSQWAIAAIIASAFQLLLFPTRPLAFRTAMRGAAERLLPLILTRMLAWLVLLGLGFAIPQMLIAQNNAGGIGAFLSLWSLGAAVFFGLQWALVSVVVMIEKRAFVRAMLRSMELMRLKWRRGFFGDGALRRLLLILLFPGVLLAAGQAASQLVSRAITGQWMLKFPENTAVILTNGAISFVVSAIVTPWLYAALVLLYAECRMKREALDIQVRMLARGETAKPEESLIALQ